MWSCYSKGQWPTLLLANATNSGSSLRCGDIRRHALPSWSEQWEASRKPSAPEAGAAGTADPAPAKLRAGCCTLSLMEQASTSTSEF